MAASVSAELPVASTSSSRPRVTATASLASTRAVAGLSPRAVNRAVSGPIQSSTTPGSSGFAHSRPCSACP